MLYRSVWWEIFGLKTWRPFCVKMGGDGIHMYISPKSKQHDRSRHPNPKSQNIAKFQSSTDIHLRIVPHSTLMIAEENHLNWHSTILIYSPKSELGKWDNWAERWKYQQNSLSVAPGKCVVEMTKIIEPKSERSGKKVREEIKPQKNDDHGK